MPLADASLPRQATFRFYAELNDFLPPERRYRPFSYRFLLPHPIKDAIESLGIPHTEVELILADGEPVGFDFLVDDGVRVSVYPVFESLDITPLLKLRPAALRCPRFVADVHLGRLAAYLRLAGFDTLYEARATDEELARWAATGPRTLLTRDAGLLKRNAVTHGYYVRSTHPPQQLAEVIRRFDLSRLVRPFSRCLRCNQPLRPAQPHDVRPRVPEAVWKRYSEFLSCSSCGRFYWQGTHYQRMQQLLRLATGAVPDPGSHEDCSGAL